MIAWFLKLLGLSSEITDHLTDTTLAVQRPAIIVIGMLLLAPIGFLIHWRQQRNLASVRPALRNVLTACRVAVLAILTGVLAGPYLKLDHKLEKRPIVALLIDHSRSMHLPAGPFESDVSIASFARAAGLNASEGPGPRQSLNRMTRINLAYSAVEACSDTLLKPIAAKFDLSVFGFDEDLKPIAIDGEPPHLGEPPSSGGKRSAIGNAIEQAIEQAGGRQVAGIILLTDGQNNAGSSLAHAATTAAHANAPVYAVPVGSATRLRDVAITDVFTSGLVSIGDTVSVSVTVESQGFDGRPVQIELSEGDRKLDEKDLTLRGAEQQQMELTFQADQAGAHYLKVQIKPLDDELVRENNQDVAYVRVDDQKLKVLYVEGPPRWDFRFLKNAMRRDHGLEPTIIVETELQEQTGEAGAKIPATVDEWSAYRTVILGDCAVETLTAHGVDALAEAVRDKGLGLVVLAGPNQMPHAYEGTALVDLLPVRARRGAAGYDAAPYNPFKIEITPAGAVHEALRLHEEPSRNAALWSQMPPYFWCAAAIRPAPGATVLATNPSIEDRFGKLPLIAYHFAGKGKAMFVGTDSTWLWRHSVGDRFFYKFWGQAIRFVARRDDTDGGKSWIEVRPLRSQPGDSVEIELTAFTQGGAPRTEPTQLVTVTGPGELQFVPLDSDGANQGRYVGHFKPKAEGAFNIRFQTGEGQESVQAELHVEYASEELRRPNLDRAALELLANHTGGQLVELSDLARIPQKLQGETKLIELHREEAIWDNWFTVVLLALIYCVDVGIRRLAGLS